MEEEKGYQDQQLALMDQYNAHRGADQLQDTYSDLGAVLDNCHNVLSMTPDLNSSTQAAENWKRIQEGVVTIMINSQNMAKQMFDAGMKVKVVNGSIEQMEKVFFSPDSQEPMKALQFYSDECQSNIQIAQKAAEIMEKTHCEEVALIKDNFEALSTSIGSSNVADLARKQRVVAKKIEENWRLMQESLNDEKLLNLNSQFAVLTGQLTESTALFEAYISQAKTYDMILEETKSRLTGYENAISQNQETSAAENTKLLQKLEEEINSKHQANKQQQETYKKRQDDLSETIASKKKDILHRIQNPRQIPQIHHHKSGGFFGFFRRSHTTTTYVNEDISSFKTQLVDLNNYEQQNTQTVQNEIKAHQNMLQNDIQLLKSSHEELQSLSKQGHASLVEGLKLQVSRIQNDLSQYRNIRDEIYTKASEKKAQAESFKQKIDDVKSQISQQTSYLTEKQNDLKIKLEQLEGEAKELHDNQEALLKANGQKSLKGLYDQLIMIENLGRSINARTLLLAKTYAFASSFSSTISQAMLKVIQGANDFKAITSKQLIPDIEDSIHSRQAFKEYMLKTFAKFPDVIKTFEDFDFDPTLLNEISQCELDDAVWNEYGITNRLSKISIKSFCNKLRESQYSNVFISVLKTSFEESKKVIHQISSVGAKSIECVSREQLPIEEDMLD